MSLIMLARVCTPAPHAHSALERWAVLTSQTCLLPGSPPPSPPTPTPPMPILATPVAEVDGGDSAFDTSVHQIDFDIAPNCCLTHMPPVATA